MITPARASGRARALVLLLMLVLTGLAGCSYSDKEPGLFRQAESSPPSEPAEPSPSQSLIQLQYPQPTTALPVLGTRVWYDAEGLGVVARIAVHAVRRFAGGTVLDWSVTPLPDPAHKLGVQLPATDLGLFRFSEGNVNVFLIDAAHHRVYRPLTALGHDELEHCLCAPQWIAERRLFVGATTMLQIAYPVLPADVDRVAVDVSTVSLFDQVPVTPIGRVPRAGAPVELAGPVTRPATTWATPFDYPSSPGQKLQIGVQAVFAGPSGTSIQWILRSLASGTAVSSDVAPPLVAVDAASVYDYASGYASAPAITAVNGRGRTPLAALSMSTRLDGLGRRECWCTDPRLWSSGLQEAGGSVELITNVASLLKDGQAPAAVDVTFPGLPTLRNVPVTRAADSSRAVRGTEPTPTRTWTYADVDPPTGWSVRDWPSPVPNDRQLFGYRSTVDDLR